MPPLRRARISLLRKRLADLSRVQGTFQAAPRLPGCIGGKSPLRGHLNDVNDPRFQAFVTPITDRAQQDFAPTDAGLDFGSGIAPIVQHVLKTVGYDVAGFDPFFANLPDLLDRTYDYITCCEVIEHFHRPAIEFERLRGMLRPGGRLYCMTILHHDDIDFRNWHYRRDDTHVFVYRRETIEWITRRFDFSNVEIDGRLIVFAVS